MKKAKIITNFVCQECGYDTTSWLGKCPECGAWNSLKEFRKSSTPVSRGSQAGSLANAQSAPQALNDIVYKEKSRIQTDFTELNTVLGGGIVRGSVTLIAGDPGVGKSTLLLQLALDLARGSKGDKGDKGEVTPVSSGLKVLYVSGEESVDQVKMRAERINVSTTGTTSTKSTTGKKARDTLDTRDTSQENLFLLALTDADEIVVQIDEIKPDLVIIDSIQTIESQNVSGLSGSVGQVRYSALQFVRSAKQNNIPIIIVGHVTKEGMVAGPMVLSHMVDTVLFLEGERFAKTRILRSLKNRFGPVDEVGIFLMEDNGMIEAANPEQLFLDDKRPQVPGSVLVVTLEGSRAFIVELQALAVFSKLPMPRRVVSGVDPRRVELLLAVLQKHVRLPVDTMDIFVNIAGGLKLSDPAIDLGICLAVYSSLKNITLSKTVGISEVGLLGELRSVTGLEKRVKEASKLGYKNIITAKTHRSLRDVIEGLGARG
ncbi:MAG TPA: DNA repair protein RadA [Xanthomonadales bacterium]|nr:DNA repair protein RadA [Xanthomonadales bacterium]